MRMTRAILLAGLTLALTAPAPVAALAAVQAPDAQSPAADPRMAALEAEANALIEAERYADADGRIADLLALEVAAYGATDWRVANSHQMRANLANVQGDLAGALTHKRLEIAARAGGAEPARLASAHLEAAVLLLGLGRPDEALAETHLARPIAQSLPLQDETRLAAVVTEADVLAELGRDEDSLRGLAAADQALVEAGSSHPLALRIAYSRAVTLSRLGRDAEAIEPGRRACDAAGEADVRLNACLALAQSLEAADRLAEAEAPAATVFETEDATPELRARSGQILRRVMAARPAQAGDEPRLRAILAANRAVDAASVETALSANGLGVWLIAQQRHDEAAEAFQAALDIYAAAEPGSAAETTVRANRVDALNRAGRADEAVADALRLADDAQLSETSRMTVAGVLEKTRPDLSETLLLRVLADRRARQATPQEMSDVFSRLANAVSPQGRWPDAVRYRTESLEQERRIGDPQREFMAMAYLGRAQVETDDTAAAYANLSEAWRRAQSVEIAPSDRHYIRRNLSIAALATGRAEEAAGLAEAAVTEARAGSPDPDVLVGALMALSDVREQQGRLEQAEALLGEALTTAATVDDGGATVSFVQTAQGNLWKVMGRYDQAERAMRQVIAFTSARYGPDNLQNAIPLKNLASIFSDTSQPGRALPLVRQAEAIEAASLPESSAQLISTRVQLADLMQAMGDQAGAEATLVRLADQADAALGPTHPTSRRARERLAWAMMGQDRYDEAAVQLEQVVRAAEDVWGPDAYELMGPLQSLAYARYMAGDWDETLAVMRRTVEVGERGGDRWPRSLALVRSNLGQTLLALGRPQEAVGPLRQASEAMRRGLVNNVGETDAEAGVVRDPFRKLVQALWRSAAAS